MITVLIAQDRTSAEAFCFDLEAVTKLDFRNKNHESSFFPY